LDCAIVEREEPVMMNWSGEMGTTGWVFMAVLCVALIAAVVWAVAALVNRNGGASASTSGAVPQEILDRRLASGEIDIETYDTLRAKLRAVA
jgi:putative membrane protein